MAIDFPANPTNGQQFTAAGVTWTWDTVKWTPGATGSGYLPLAGGNLTGPLTGVTATFSGVAAAADPVDGDSSSKLVTTAWFGRNFYAKENSNRIINGDMRIDQRNNGAVGTAVGYTIDRWQYSANQASKGTWVRNSAGPSGFPYSLFFQSSSAYASLATDFFIFRQHIEADMVSDFAWGTAGAQPATLSFWAWSTLSGTFSGSVGNYAGTRSYPFSYSLSASAWTKVAVTIPGDTAGTWVMSGNAGALIVMFDLGSGANGRGPANAWAGVNYLGVTGSVSVVATNAATFAVTGVKLEIGNVATPYPRQSLAKSLADCQRYYQTYGSLIVFDVPPGASGVTSQFTFVSAMRATPTLTPSGMTYINSSALNVNVPAVYGARFNITAAAMGAAYCIFGLAADAEL